MSNRKKMNWTALSREEASEEERECDWDEPLPSSSSSINEEEETEFSDDIQRKENLAKLDQYVARMAYIPAPPPKPYKHITMTDHLATPKHLNADFAEVMKYLTGRPFDSKDNNVFYEFPERAERMEALAASFRTIPPEQFEEFHKAESEKKRKRDNIAKRKEKIFYDLSSKLEKQSRAQYLDALINKFAEFVADMATTMNIPPQLNEPYARMQRGIFYNIVCSLGIQPQNQAAYYYNTQDAIEYDTIHKCSHAILCLIIKALDASALKNPDDIQSMEKESDMDIYIRERLMSAAMKKLHKAQGRKPDSYKTCVEKTTSKCNKFADRDPCLNFN